MPKSNQIRNERTGKGKSNIEIYFCQRLLFKEFTRKFNFFGPNRVKFLRYLLIIGLIYVFLNHIDTKIYWLNRSLFNFEQNSYKKRRFFIFKLKKIQLKPIALHLTHKSSLLNCKFNEFFKISFLKNFLQTKESFKYSHQDFLL